MMCTECNFRSDYWKNEMLSHYRKDHPWVKKPWIYFTKAARNNIVGEPCGCNAK